MNDCFSWVWSQKSIQEDCPFTPLFQLTRGVSGLSIQILSHSLSVLFIHSHHCCLTLNVFPSACCQMSFQFKWCNSPPPRPRPVFTSKIQVIRVHSASFPELQPSPLPPPVTRSWGFSCTKQHYHLALSISMKSWIGLIAKHFLIFLLWVSYCSLRMKTVLMKHDPYIDSAWWLNTENFGNTLTLMIFCSF